MFFMIPVIYMQNTQSFAFSEFKVHLGAIVADEGISFDEIADDPKGDSINLTFGSDQEPTIDRVVRRTRKDLLRHNHIDLGAWREDGFTFEIKKSFIVRPACWSLSFSFAERYRFVENFQS